MDDALDSAPADSPNSAPPIGNGGLGQEARARWIATDWHHHLKWKKFASKIGFAGALLGLSTADNNGAQRLEWILAGVVSLTAAILLLEAASEKVAWKRTTSWIEDDFDLTYVSAGLGLMIGGIKALGAHWFFVGLLVLAVGIILAAYLGIGQQLLGKPVAKMAKGSAQATVVVGGLMAIIGGIWVVRSVLMEPISQDLWTAIPFVGVGILAVWGGIRNLRPNASGQEWTQ